MTVSPKSSFILVGKVTEVGMSVFIPVGKVTEAGMSLLRVSSLLSGRSQRLGHQEPTKMASEECSQKRWSNILV